MIFIFRQLSLFLLVQEIDSSLDYEKPWQKFGLLIIRENERAEEMSIINLQKRYIM